MKKILHTERLTLREFTPDDADFIIKLVNTPKWLAYIGDKQIKTKTHADTYIKDLQASYKKDGFGLWLIALKADETPIGMCGLVNRDSLEDIDVGFALLPDYEEQGYAYEAAKATMHYAKTSLNIDKIVGITNTENLGSIKLLNKLGLSYEKTITLSHGDTVLLFS